MLNALDLFHGAAGGWSLGFHRAGIRTVAACEIDPWRRQVYGRNNPGVRLYNDVRTLTADRLRADGVGPIDILAGSPPCQDASTANTKGKGVEGERTGLFFEALRLVRELRPTWVSLENVPGLRARGYDRVHDELEADGYQVWPLVVGAWHAGAPHRRNRVWIIAKSRQRERFPNLRQGQGLTSGSAPQDCGAVRAGDVVQSPDAASDGRGPGRTRRSDRRVEGQTEPALGSAADPKTLLGPEVARDQSDRDSERAVAHPEEVTGGADPTSHSPNLKHALTDSLRTNTAGDGTHRGRLSRSPDVERTDGNADETGLEIDRGEPGDDGAQLTPLERAIAERCGPIAETWNGGVAGRGRVDDGLPKGMARAALAAYGDAVCPQITEIIGRFIVEFEAEREVP